MSLVRSNSARNGPAKGPLTRAALRFFGQSGDGGQLIRTPRELEQALRAGRGTPSGVSVNDDNALRVGAVYACVNLLANSVSMLPQGLFTRRGPHDFEPATGHAVNQLIESRPNAYMTPAEYKRLAVTWLLLRGNFYAYKLRKASTGEPQELIPIHPDKMLVSAADDGTPRYKSLRKNGEWIKYKPGDIHHIRMLSLDGLVGISVLSAAANSIGASIVAEAFGAKLFSNGAKPGGVLKHPNSLSDEAAARLKEDVEAQISGDNAHRLLLLEEGLEYEAIALTAEEAQFIESRKFTRGEIAMFFGVPPHMIGDIDRGTSWGTGIEQQGLGFVTYTIGPLLRNIAEAEARDLLTAAEAPRMAIRFDTSELTRTDFLTRQQGLQIQRANGVISPDDWRAIEGKGPRPDGAGGVYSTPSAVTAQPAAPPAAPDKAKQNGR